MRLVCTCWLLMFAMQLNAEIFGREIEDYSSTEVSFYNDWWQNPTMRFVYPTRNYSDVSLSWRDENKEAFDIQQGSRDSEFLFRANSFYKGQTELYYGKATYKKGSQHGVLWNAVADAPRLQPYIIADVVGGKNYKEDYSFSGGYARKWHCVSLGTYASYRAMTSYRRRDPRPRHTVSDLNLGIGLSINLSTRYILGWELSMENYSQDLNLSIYRNGGGASVYFLRGLGVVDAFFSTNIYSSKSLSAKYEQERYESSVSLLPKGKKGLFVLGSFQFTQLSLFSDSRLSNDISSSNTYDANLQGGYRFLLQDRQMAVKTIAHYKRILGTEYNYDREMNLIGKMPKYKEKDFRFGGVLQGELIKKKSLHSNFLFGGDFIQQEMLYRAENNMVLNKEIYRNLNIYLIKNIRKDFKRSVLSFQTQLSYRHCLSEELIGGLRQVGDSYSSLIVPMHDFYTKDRVSVALSARYDYYIGKKYSLYAKSQGSYEHYQSIGNNSKICFALGLAF